MIKVAAMLLLAGVPAVQAATGLDEMSCDVKPTVRGISQTSDKKVEILADDISFPDRGVVHLKGYTQLIRGGHRVYADELTYDKNANTVVATGVVKFETPQGDVIHTSVLNYDIQTGKIVTGPAEFLLADRQSRLLGDGHSTVNAYGTAGEIVLEGGNVLNLTDARVTSCLEGEQDMTFTADSLMVDTDQGIRTAERTKVRISAPERHEKLDKAIDSLQ
jgi:lipopolysaccharide export system protein LptA